MTKAVTFKVDMELFKIMTERKKAIAEESMQPCAMRKYLTDLVNADLKKFKRKKAKEKVCHQKAKKQSESDSDDSVSVDAKQE